MSNARGDEWYTPKWLIEALGTFDLDPAAPRRGHWTATRCYTEEDDGLALPWYGRVFLNPPYSNPSPWVEKLVEHRNAIALYFARTDTKWMQRALDKADAVFLLKGRVRFVDMDGNQFQSAPAPSLLLAFGAPNVAALRVAQARNLISGKLFCEHRETDDAYGSRAADNRHSAKAFFGRVAAD